MGISNEELRQLLNHGESSSLEWKADFPSGLLHRSKGDREWDKGRATVMKDLVSIANNDEPGPGYLIYGVKDSGASRTIVGASASFDDSVFQTWAQNTFDPPPTFSYSEIALDKGKTVGLFIVERVPAGPHVVSTNIGGFLFEGQVWFRRGSKNTVAHQSDLRRMFSPAEPFKVTRLDGQELLEVKRHYEDLGETFHLPRFSDKDAMIERGFRLAYFPGTRREVWVVWALDNRPEHIAMLGPRADASRAIR